MWSIAVAAAVALTYHLAALRFAARILTGFWGGPAHIALAAMANTGLLFFTRQLELPYAFVYLLMTLVVVAEFCAMSKAGFREALLGSSIFVAHLCSMHLFCTGLYASVLRAVPILILRDPALYSNSLALTFLLALLTLLLFPRLIKVEEILELIRHRAYSWMVCAIAVFMIVYTGVDAQMLMADEPFSHLFYACALTAVESMALFYILLHYTLYCVKLSGQKERLAALTRRRDESACERSRLEEKRTHDCLTGCYNRAFLLEKLDELLRAGQPGLAVLFLDVNGMKCVNDALGHAMGDRYLRFVSGAIAASTRAHDFVGRLAGDEFVVLLRQIHEEELPGVCARIKHRVEQAPGLAVGPAPSVSVGCVYVDGAHADWDGARLLEEADRVMLLDKARYYGGDEGPC